MSIRWREDARCLRGLWCAPVNPFGRAPVRVVVLLAVVVLAAVLAGIAVWQLPLSKVSPRHSVRRENGAEAPAGTIDNLVAPSTAPPTPPPVQPPVTAGISPIQPPQAASPPPSAAAHPPVAAIPPPVSEAIRPDPPPPPVTAPASPPRVPSPVILSTDPPLSSIDAALQSLSAAHVAFNNPEHARVGRPIVVEAKLSPRMPVGALRALITEAGKVETADLKVSDRMAATLNGGSGFDVAPSGPQEQWISTDQATSWTWTVTPKAVGEQILILSFDALITVNGKDDKRTVNTLTHHIDVDVGWPDTFGEWLDLIKKTGENISWIWVALLGVGGGAWAWIKRHRSSQKPATSTQESPTAED
jgi:hypothetical protein